VSRSVAIRATTKFLELALAGRADFLLTGDADLLALHPFRGTTTLTPTAYLAGS
jgi:predicted nucleic acid-binding protein